MFNIGIEIIMRSIWKGPFIDKQILKEIDKLQKEGKKRVPIKIISKNSVIFPSFVGLNFSIFNGKIFTNLIVSEAMIGHKFGEFIVTKKFSSHKKSK